MNHIFTFMGILKKDHEQVLRSKPAVHVPEHQIRDIYANSVAATVESVPEGDPKSFQNRGKGDLSVGIEVPEVTENWVSPFNFK